MSKLHGRRRRTITVLLAMMAAISLFAASPAAGASSFVFRAGTVCAFDVQLADEEQPQDGSVGDHARAAVNADITITNLETGATYLWSSRYTGTETFDPTTKTYHVTDVGRILSWFFDGDIGPDGPVGESGALLGFDGTREYTITKKGVVTAFSFTGTYIDICALLS